jgi:chromosomal replication initiation ATPase DnaA
MNEPVFITQQPSIDTIIRMVAPTFGVTRLDILSHRRDQTSTLARHTAMWLARRLTKHSLPTLGRHFDRDHTTVRDGAMRIDAMMESNPGIGGLVLGLMDSLTLPPLCGKHGVVILEEAAFTEGAA